MVIICTIRKWGRSPVIAGLIFNLFLVFGALLSILAVCGTPCAPPVPSHVTHNVEYNWCNKLGLPLERCSAFNSRQFPWTTLKKSSGKEIKSRCVVYLEGEKIIV